MQYASLLLVLLFVGANKDERIEAPASSQQTRQQLLDDLNDTTGKPMANAINRISAERRDTVNALIALLNSNRTDAVFKSAKSGIIAVLGDYRSPQAVDCLLDHLESQPFRVRGNLNPLMNYPAAEALAEVGSPAIPKILARLASPQSDKRFTIFAHILHRIDGKEVGLYRLQVELKKYDEQRRAYYERRKLEFSEDEKTKNLKRLIEIYEQLDFAQPVP